jgi:hypothetical protein
MAATYEPIATQTLGSAATSITFSSIAADWTDLRLVLPNVLDAMVLILFVLDSIPILQLIIQLPDLVVNGSRLQFLPNYICDTNNLRRFSTTSTTIPTFYGSRLTYFLMLAQHTKLC